MVLAIFEALDDAVAGQSRNGFIGPVVRCHIGEFLGHIGIEDRVECVQTAFEHLDVSYKVRPVLFVHAGRSAVQLEGYAAADQVFAIPEGGGDVEHDIVDWTIEQAYGTGGFTAVCADGCRHAQLGIFVKIQRMQVRQGGCIGTDFVNAGFEFVEALVGLVQLRAVDGIRAVGGKFA